jgi:hypothetical protein
MDKITGLQSANLCDHHRQKRIGCNIKRYAQKDIGAALVQLARQFAVGHIKLEERMAWRQGNFSIGDIFGERFGSIGQNRRIPRRNEHSAAVRIGFQGFDNFGNLVDFLAVPIAPLVAINGSEFAIFIGPFVPDLDAIFVEVGNIGVAFEKPQQFIDNRFEVEFFGRHHRETFRKIKAHLITENAFGSGSGAVAFLGSGF